MQVSYHTLHKLVVKYLKKEKLSIRTFCVYDLCKFNKGSIKKTNNVNKNIFKVVFLYMICFIIMMFDCRIHIFLI